MNYDDMPAGPELDRLVAERVMGWSIKRHYQPESFFFYAKEDDAIFVNGEMKWWADAWSPSTNIAHAFEVVEHMMQTTKETWEFHSTTTLHTAIFEFDGGRDRPWKPGQYVGDALSMPLAISRAALKAVGGS